MEYTPHNITEKQEISEIQVTCYLNLAACYQKTKDWATSFESCNYAISIDSNSGRAYFRRAQVKKRIKMVKKGIETGSLIQPTMQ